MKIVSNGRFELGIIPKKDVQCKQICDFRHACNYMDCENLARKAFGKRYNFSGFYLRSIGMIELFCRKQGIWRKYQKNRKRVIDNREKVHWPGSSIGNSFHWASTPEGREFWDKMSYRYEKWIDNKLNEE